MLCAKNYKDCFKMLLNYRRKLSRHVFETHGCIGLQCVILNPSRTALYWKMKCSREVMSLLHTWWQCIRLCPKKYWDYRTFVNDGSQNLGALHQS